MSDSTDSLPSFPQLPTLLANKEETRKGILFYILILEVSVCANITTYLFNYAHISIFQAVHSLIQTFISSCWHAPVC